MTAFVHAADTKSFTLAAQRLGLTSSAIGKIVSRLEERLGVRLFHRSTRALALTDEGGLFLQRCRRILNEMDAAEAELAQTKATPRGRLRVSLPILNSVTVPILCAFMQDYPEIELDLDFSDRVVDIIEEGVDVALRAGDVNDSRLMSRVVGEFQLRLVASPSYLSRHGVPHKPEDLTTHACLHHRYINSGKLEPWPLRRDSPELELILPTTAIANTIEPLIAMAEQGLGIACLPDNALTQQLADGRLLTVLDEFVQHSGPFRLLWPFTPYPSPKLRVFIEFMASNLSIKSPHCSDPQKLDRS